MWGTHLASPLSPLPGMAVIIPIWPRKPSAQTILTAQMTETQPVAQQGHRVQLNSQSDSPIIAEFSFGENGFLPVIVLRACVSNSPSHLSLLLPLT